MVEANAAETSHSRVRDTGAHLHRLPGAVLHCGDLRLGERPNRMIVPVPDPAVLVVYRNPEVPAAWMIRARRDHADARHDPLRDAPVVFAAIGVAAGADEKPARAFDHL